MRRGVLGCSLLCAAWLATAAPPARADACGVPSTSPFWVDYAGHDSPMPAKPGLVLALSSGVDKPAGIRAAGAATVFFDLHLNGRVGTPSEPADPATIADKASRLFDYAVAVTGCSTPVIAENELFGAQTLTPWSGTNAQYRGNVLALLQDLAARGARPYLTIANPPYTGGDAAEWWRQAAQAAVLVRQVFFTAPNVPQLYALGPARASRNMRQGMRGLVGHLTEIGIPPSRIALELQFQSAPGEGGREGLEPKQAWLEIVKLEALAARQAAKETHIESVWSWGWATFSQAGIDRDKGAAVCVYLWARDPRLCDGPAAAGPGFDASLTEGQLDLPDGIECELGTGRIKTASVRSLTRILGDRGLAEAVLLERAILRERTDVTAREVDDAVRGVVSLSFGGSSGRFIEALQRVHASESSARELIGDRLRRAQVEALLPVGSPAAAAVSDFLRTYAATPARLVEAKPGASWLGGGTRGIAIQGLAPPQVFQLASGRPARLSTLEGRIRVRALGPVAPLELLPAAEARAAAAVALSGFAREDAYAPWLLRAETRALGLAVCRGDVLPAVGPVDLADVLPFLP